MLRVTNKSSVINGIFRLQFLVILGLDVAACRQVSVACVLTSVQGVKVVVAIVEADDSDVDYVEARVWTEWNWPMAWFVPIGFTQDPIGCDQVGIYETHDGRYIGLYERSFPHVIIMLVDMDQGRTLTSPSRSTALESGEMIAKLSRDTGFPLEFGGKYLFSRKRFLDWPPVMSPVSTDESEPKEGE
jgi:hypothetical protein